MAGKAETSDLASQIETARLDLHRHFRPRRVEKALSDIVDTAASVGDDWAVARARLELAAIARYQHELDRALSLATDALQRFNLRQDKRDVAAAHLELAKIALDSEEDPEPHLGRAEVAVFDLSQEIKARVDYVRARAALRRGGFCEAGRLLRRALSRLESLDGCTYYQARYLAQLGLVERLRGAKIAVEHLQSAKRLAEHGGYVRIQAACLLDLGQINLKQSNYALAYQRLVESAALFTRIDDHLGGAHAHSALGAVLRLTGRVEKAIESLQRALAVFVARNYLEGEALAHRRLAQCYADMLDGQVAHGQGICLGNCERALEEITLAIGQFEELRHLDGRAVALATKGRLLYQTKGAEAALVPAMEAIELLGQVRGQLRQGVERLEFCRLHAWVFGFAMLWAAEANDVAKALRIAAVVRAETLGGAARQVLATAPGDPGDRLREALEHEQALRRSASWAVPLTISMPELRVKRDRIVGDLVGGWADALTPSLERSALPAGCYRLCVYLFDDDLFVVWEGPAGAESGVRRTKLSGADRRCVEAVTRGDIDALWDARPRQWARFGDLVVPTDLGPVRAMLIGGEVRVLEIETALQLVAFPFGSILVDGRPLDELANVLLSPSDLPWLWRDQDDHRRRVNAARQPPMTEDTDTDTDTETAFRELVNDLGPSGSWNIVELMEIAAGDPTLKRLFPGDPAVAPHFSMTVEQNLQNGMSLLAAVRDAKANHRRSCGSACPPAHVGGYVVAGRLTDAPNTEGVSS